MPLPSGEPPRHQHLEEVCLIRLGQIAVIPPGNHRLCRFMLLMTQSPTFSCTTMTEITYAFLPGASPSQQSMQATSLPGKSALQCVSRFQILCQLYKLPPELAPTLQFHFGRIVVARLAWMGSGIWILIKSPSWGLTYSIPRDMACTSNHAFRNN